MNYLRKNIFQCISLDFQTEFQENKFNVEYTIEKSYYSQSILRSIYV